MYGISVHIFHPASILSDTFLNVEQVLKPALTKKIEGSDPPVTPAQCAAYMIRGSPPSLPSRSKLSLVAHVRTREERVSDHVRASGPHAPKLARHHPKEQHLARHLLGFGWYRTSCCALGFCNSMDYSFLTAYTTDCLPCLEVF